MKKRGIACVLALIATMSLVACGTTKKENTTDENHDTDVKNNFSVSIVSDTGGINDQSFNQSAWEALERLNDKYGVKVSYLESVQASDYATNLDKMIDQGNDFIWGVGFSMADELYTTASMNSEQLFGIIDHSYGDENLDNVICMMFRNQEASFLVGYVAGKTTQSNQVGFVGGIGSAIIDQFEYGYRAGVAYAAEELGKEITVSVQYAESFSDAARAKAIAAKMYTSGCDVIFQAAGNAGNGVIEAAKEADKYVIGVDRDQYSLAPENVLTSALKRVDEAVFLVSKEVMDGKDFGGSTLEYGLTEGTVGIPTENPNMDPTVYTDTMKVQELIKEGKITVPYNSDTFEAFITK